MGPDLSTTRPAQVEGWGEKVHGLQVKLVSEQSSLKVGESLHLRLDIRNASNRRITLELPHILPIISAAGDHPYPVDHNRNVVITAHAISGQKVHIRWAQRLLKPAPVERAVLAPLDRISVQVLPCPVKQSPTTAAVVDDQQTNHRQACADFAYGWYLGTYRLVATYTVDRPGVWQGTLVTPPIDLEVTPATEENRGDRKGAR
ncbi:MAG TPA: hypothetical protein VGR35_00515 [Tepidisphaeraceae bacterium]|nr:hypothetical protein [Tepidisphaeraceae bacterium]